MLCPGQTPSLSSRDVFSQQQRTGFLHGSRHLDPKPGSHKPFAEHLTGATWQEQTAVNLQRTGCCNIRDMLDVIGIVGTKGEKARPEPIGKSRRKRELRVLAHLQRRAPKTPHTMTARLAATLRTAEDHTGSTWTMLFGPNRRQEQRSAISAHHGTKRIIEAPPTLPQQSRPVHLAKQ